MSDRRFRRLCAALFLCLPFAPCSAELLRSDLGFYLELPEGYFMSAEAASGQYQFTDPSGRATFQLKAYEGTRYAGAAAMRDDVAKRLGAKASGRAYRFQDRDAFLGEVTFSLSGQAQRGYMFCLDGKGGERDYLILSYVDSGSFPDMGDFLLSALDSFSVDAAGLRLPGPLSWFDCPLSGGREERKRLRFGAASLELALPADSSKAAQELIEREFNVLSAYAGVEGSWREAWRRFYRMAYRDSYHRLDQAAFLLGVEIEKAGRPELGERPASLSDARLPPERYVDGVLSWLQGFSYKRGQTESDTLNPLDCALSATGDCDARALLMAILLHHWNIDAGMAVSQEYSHALALVDLPGKPGLNAGIEAGGKRYLVAETTDRVKPGLIAKEQSDPEKWIGIDFGF
jgi:hypothetical protein